MKSISEIYDVLAAKKDSFSELDEWVTTNDGTLDSPELLLADIKSQSKVATWRLWLWIMAVGSWIIESLFEVHKTEVNAILAAKAPHTLRWYSEESKKYRDGEEPQFNGNFFEYLSEVTTLPLIKYAAASEVGNKIILKVAKGTGNTKLPLDTDELIRFNAFWSQWKDAGVMLECVSLSADSLKVVMTIERDRLVLNDDNTLIRDASINPITDAIATYGNSLEFDGMVRLSKLVDAIQAAEGVIDVKLVSAQHKPDGGTYSAVDMSVVTASGYIVIDYANSTINYTDNINVAIITE